MATVVQSNYEALQQISQRFQNRAQRTQQMIQVLKQSHARLQQSWEGKGAHAFTQEMTRVVLPAVVRLQQALQGAALTTRKIAQMMEQAETEAAALFRDEGSTGTAGGNNGGMGTLLGSENGNGSGGASGEVLLGGGDVTTPVISFADIRDFFNGGDGSDPTVDPEATAEPESDPHEVPFESDTLPIASDDIEWQGGFGPNQYSQTTYNTWSADIAELDAEIAAVAEPTDEQRAAWDQRRREINADYPYENTGGLHGGLDFGADSGTDVTAIAEGEIVDVYSGDASPNVVVRYGEGDDAYYVVYGHVDMNEELEVGDTIAAGDVVGTVSDQGTNSHLHLAIRQDSQVYNPLYFFSDTAGADGIFEDAPYPDGEDSTSMFSFQYSSSANYWSNPDAKSLEIVE